MIHRFLLPLAALLLLMLPARSQKEAGEKPREYPTSAKLVFKVSEGDKVIAKAALHTDLQGNDHDEIEGSTTLILPDGRRWRVDISSYMGGKDEEERRLWVKIKDFVSLEKGVEDGTSYTVAVLIFEADRIWRGPGVYRLAEQGDMVISAEMEVDPLAVAEPDAAPEKE